MNKFIAIPITVLLVFTLGACNNSKSGTISVVELTERENAILHTTSDNSFVFDFDTVSDFREGSAWIEKYEANKLVDDKMSHLTTEVEKSGTLILATSTNIKEKQITFNVGIGSNGGVSSVNGYDPNSHKLDSMTSVYGSFQGLKTIEKGEMVLASICYSKNGMISSFTEDFYEDFNSHINELNKCDVTYLLKAEFIK